MSRLQLERQAEYVEQCMNIETPCCICGNGVSHRSVEKHSGTCHHCHNPIEVGFTMFNDVLWCRYTGDPGKVTSS